MRAPQPLVLPVCAVNHAPMELGRLPWASYHYLSLIQHNIEARPPSIPHIAVTQFKCGKFSYSPLFGIYTNAGFKLKGELLSV